MSGHGTDGGALPDPRVEEVGDGVFAYIQPDGTWWINNTGFVVGGSRVLAVDACSTERRTRALVAAIRQVLSGAIYVSPAMSSRLLTRLLDVAPDDIKADEPLYGDGLGLDSIDVLEIALVVSKRYGLQLRADNDDNHRIFSSLASLTDYIAQHKAA